MIVELAGPPGAGKTTLLPATLSFFEEQGLAAFTVVDAARPFTARTAAGRLLQRMSPAALRDPLLWRLFLLLSFVYRLRFVASRPRLIWNVLRWQRRRPQEAGARQRKVSFWLLRLMGYYEFLTARMRPEEVLVLDEGFLHRVVQLFSSSVEEPNGGRIRRYTRLIPRPDLVIFVFASAATCQARIYERGLWEAFRGKEPDEVASFVENAYRASMIALKFSRAQGWAIIEVDNGGETPEQAQTALRRELRRVAARETAGVGLGVA